jgi:murein DD-endopeptidase MepM/ murein hydrolase activator NlpD
VPHIVQEGETLLDLAVLYNAPVSHLRYMNDLPYPAKIYPGQRLRMPGEKTYNDLPGEWTAVEIEPELIRQGDTVTIYVENLQDGTPSGSFSDQELTFSEYEDGFVTLVGLDAFTPAGAHSLELGGAGERPWYPFEQDISVESSNFPNQVITVEEGLNDLLEPSVRAEEDAFLSTIYSVYSEDKKWSGLFQVPVTDTLVTAPYGGGRSYNEGPVTIFHTGTDFDGSIGTPILAAADGVVVFNDELALRGKAVIIDHGWGVMTGYYHLSESFVEEGQTVEAGQAIGAGGSTGLSTGPHLHWELRILDVAVDGMKWIEEVFPQR